MTRKTNTTNLVERNACLDTQVFWAANFSYGSKSFELLQKAVEGKRIRLFMTDIIDREVRASIRKLVKNAQNAVQKIGKDTRVLLNHPDLADLVRFRDKPLRISVESALLAQYTQFLTNAKVTIIDTRSTSTGVIIDRYFRQVSPFEHRDEKKSEFPDAISLEGLAQWCNNRATAMYVVSGDKGVRAGCSYTSFPQSLLPVETIDNLLEMIARSEDTFAADAAPEAFRAAVADIKESIEAQFSDFGFYLEDQNGDVDDISIDSITLGDPLLIEVEPVDDSERLATFDVDAEVRFRAHVEYDDPDASYYDREDQTTYVFNRIKRTIEESVQISVQVTLEFDPGRPQVPENIDVSLDRKQTISVTLDEF